MTARSFSARQTRLEPANQPKSRHDQLDIRSQESQKEVQIQVQHQAARDLAHAQTSPAVTPGTGQMYRATSLRGSDAGRTALAGWVKRGYARCARRSSPPWVTRKEMYETQI